MASGAGGDPRKGDEHKILYDQPIPVVRRKLTQEKALHTDCVVVIQLYFFFDIPKAQPQQRGNMLSVIFVFFPIIPLTCRVFTLRLVVLRSFQHQHSIFKTIATTGSRPRFGYRPRPHAVPSATDAMPPTPYWLCTATDPPSRPCLGVQQIRTFRSSL